MDQLNSQHRLFKFNLIKLPQSATLKSIGIYLSGALYAIAFWVVIDIATFSKTVNASTVHVTFIDWLPFISSTLGMLIVNSIEKSNLISSTNDAYGGGTETTTKWQARFVLFLGFSLLALGFSGSFLVLILKYLVKGFNEMPTVWMGIGNIVANGSAMLSCIVLWVVQNIEEDNFNYSLAL